QPPAPGAAPLELELVMSRSLLRRLLDITRLIGASGEAVQGPDVLEEVQEARGQLEVREVSHGRPGDLSGVVAGDRVHVEVEDGHGEVEDHEVRAVGLVGDALDPAEEAVDHDLETGLLADLTHDGFVERLSPLDPAAGHRPHPCCGPVPAADEEDAVAVERDGPDRHLGRAHAESGRFRCITSARAVKPCSSKKFFVARWPGSARASTPVQPRSMQNSISAFAIASPTPTERAPSSTNRSLITPSRAPPRSCST